MYLIRLSLLFACLLLCLVAETAQAGMAEVRDAARQNNCPPKKIEVLRQTIGTVNETLYQVECNLPKAKDQAANAPTGITIKCQMNLCQAMR